jgi:hypothetical protein
MNTRSNTVERAGAAAGLAAVLLLVTLFTVLPALPAPNRSIAEIARHVRDERTGLLLGAYAGALMTCALLLFGATLAARLRRAEGADGGWWLVALVGICGTAIGIAGNALEIVFIRAVGHGVTGRPLWIGYGADHWLSVLTAIPLALFLFAAAMGARTTGALPRWLAWLALALSVLFVLGAASVTGDEVDGGILGMPLVVAYLGLIVWVAGTSLTLVRRPRVPAIEASPEPVATS